VLSKLARIVYLVVCVVIFLGVAGAIIQWIMPTIWADEHRGASTQHKVWLHSGNYFVIDGPAEIIALSRGGNFELQSVNITPLKSQRYRVDEDFEMYKYKLIGQVSAGRWEARYLDADFAYADVIITSAQPTSLDIIRNSVKSKWLTTALAVVCWVVLCGLITYWFWPRLRGYRNRDAYNHRE
jgi:hypothetical protein